MGYGLEGVGATFVLIDAVVTEAPFAFVAVRASPEAWVGEGLAVVAEHALLQPPCWVVGGHCLGVIGCSGLD